MTSRDCSWSRVATGYAAGDLRPELNTAFEEHLLEGCGACGRALESARNRIGEFDVLRAGRDVLASLPARLKSSILERIRSKPSSDACEELAGGIRIQRRQAGFVATGFDGVQSRRLALDEELREATSLVKMAPGASYPRHRHRSREQCYVLWGEVRFADEVLRVGDYQVAEPGSVHEEHWTIIGCLLLVVAGLDDELLD